MQYVDREALPTVYHKLK